MSKRDEIRLALRDAFPIMIAYFPLSMTYGVLAAAGSLSPLLTIFSSVWIYSGGAQFMMLGMFAAASAPVMVVTTILLVSMRHVLYGATMGPYVANWKESLKWTVAYGLTDEGFAVTSSKATREGRLEPAYYLTFAFAGYGSWVAGTVVGTALGGWVTPEVATILGFALPALFLALLLGGDRTLPSMAAAGSGAVIATLAGMFHLGGAGLVIGGVAGATIGQKLKNRLQNNSAAKSVKPSEKSV